MGEASGIGSGCTPGRQERVRGVPMGGANERERIENEAQKAGDKFWDSLKALKGLLEDAPDAFFVYTRCEFVPHAV